jgi:hypothetical protein
MNRLILVIIVWISFCSIGNGQYRMAFGAAGGGNFYLGDGNPSYPFLQVQEQYGGLLRFYLSPRYALKINGYYGTLNGSTKYSSNYLPNDAQYAFSKKFWDIGLNLEYNFFPLSIAKGETNYTFTPYIYTGFGMTLLPGGNNGMVTAPHFPFGGGVKWKVFENLTLGAEIGIRKMFTDQLDTYNAGDVLNDPYNLNGSSIINNDYYTCFGFFATISIFKHKWRCSSMGTYN